MSGAEGYIIPFNLPRPVNISLVFMIHYSIKSIYLTALIGFNSEQQETPRNSENLRRRIVGAI